MEESLSITDKDKFVTKFTLYWSKRHSDLTIQENDSAGVLVKMMLPVSPEILRTIADQFYAWADTLDSELDPPPLSTTAETPPPGTSEDTP